MADPPGPRMRQRRLFNSFGPTNMRVVFFTTVIGVLSVSGVYGLPPGPHEDTKFRSLDRVWPPHCTKTPITISSPSMSAPSAILREIQHMHFDIGLKSTVCFRLEDNKSNSTKEQPSSWLHTITLDRLQHHHPVPQHYVFAIPEVNVSCICECSHSDRCNAGEYKYRMCPAQDNQDPETSCYRTFFPDQSPNGCPTGSNPSLCCELRFRPYQNQTYTAVLIEQPSTYATFLYNAYDYESGSWIRKQNEREIHTQLDGGTQDKILDDLGRLELSVSAGGRASHQLETGMYFARTNRGGEMDGIRQMPINVAQEFNYQRLGWYRERFGKFEPYNGEVRLDKVHNAKSTNCRAQSFMSTLDANYYMPGHFNLSRPIERLHPWIERARLYDGKARSVVVTHAEGTNLRIMLRVTGDHGNRVLFFHNASTIHDFTGTIVVDSRSNRYFNVTLQNASGMLNGIVKRGTTVDTDDVHSFTTYVNDLRAVNKTLIIPLPVTVEEGSRMICMRADEMPEERQICRVVTYHEIPLEVDIDHNSFREGTGVCPDCNSVNLETVMNYLNPLRWAHGVNDIGEFIVMLTDVVIYVGSLFLLYMVITKVIIPVCQCCNWCLRTIPTHPPRPSKSSKYKEEHHEKAAGVTHVHIGTLHWTPPRPATPPLCGCSDCSSEPGGIRPSHASPPPRYAEEHGVDV